MLSQREWQFAKSENFMFTVPVQVAWESLDSSMISRLFVRHPHLGLQAAQLARRVLVFHRGSGVAQCSSYFIEEKLDFLLDFIFTNPFWRLARFVHSWLCPAAYARAQNLRHEMKAEALADASAFEASSSYRQSHRRGGYGGGPTTERVNLDRSLPSLCRLLRKLCSELTIQEPTFSEVVVVYAELASAETDSSAARANMFTADGGAPSPRPAPADATPRFRLKSFRDIPVADVEVVLPGLRVERMKSADVVKLVLLLLAGVDVLLPEALQLLHLVLYLSERGHCKVIRQ